MAKKISTREFLKLASIRLMSRLDDNGHLIYTWKPSSSSEPLIVVSSETIDADVLTCEREFVQSIPLDMRPWISVGGYALTKIPLGVVCVYGKNLDSLITSFRREKDALSQCAAMNIPSSRDISNEELVSNFVDVSSETMGGFGPERIRYALRQFDFPEDTCMFILLEQWKGEDTFKITLPGGKRQLGETSAECAVREFIEETGIIIQETMFEEKVVYNAEMKSNFYFLDADKHL
jgi:hypothetical protein